MKPILVEASCCNVDVINGLDGVLVTSDFTISTISYFVSLLKLFKKEDYSLKIRDLLIRSDKWKYYEVTFASINRPCLDCICQIKLETMQVLHRPPVLD